MPIESEPFIHCGTTMIDFPENTSVFEAIARHRAEGKRIVFTNGCFDILHVGHLRYLQEARALGDLLVIGLNSDQSVKMLKGPTRPILPQAERREMLLALKPVDYVVLFGEETSFEIISYLIPDVLVKGGDWTEDRIIGADVVRAHGGTVRSLPYRTGHSTTSVIERIKNNA